MKIIVSQRAYYVYSREDRDYAMYLDDELVGFARTAHEAETTLQALEMELLKHGVAA